MELNVRLTAKDTQCDGVFAALERLCKCFVQPEIEKGFTINPDKPKNEAKGQASVPQMTPRTPGIPTAAVQQPAAAPAPPAVTGIPTAPPVQTSQVYDIPQIAAAAVAYADTSAEARKRVEDLIHSFGADALTNIPKESLGAFVTSLRGLGARI